MRCQHGFFGYKDKRRPDDINILWQVARGAQDHSITPELWGRAVDIFKSGRAKLTQAMFWYCPDSHFPVDAQTTPYLKSKGFEVNVTGWISYQDLLRQVKEQIGKPFFQISHEAWASNQPTESKTHTVRLTAAETDLRINKELLALAVKRTIRPYLVDKDYLGENELEGYQHNQIIPKAQPLLSPESLNNDPINSVKNAIRAAQNLLSQYEHARPLHFLDECDPEEARQNFIDLLHGDDELRDRIDRFKNWADWKKHKKEGNPIGFNATIISYLLCMFHPETHAFCKPENYQMAAKALLGSEQIEHDTYKRIIHATNFYQTVLKIFQEEHGLPFTDLMHVHIAFWVLKNWGDGVPSWDDLMKEDTGVEQKDMKNLNTILYGPPGTGKTYQTARLAVEIIDGESPIDRTELMARYHQLADAGRISFVTFHQSFSYEEFVEGIRSVLKTDDESGRVSYELSDGIFKQACQVAQGVGHSQVGGYELGKGANFWKISLGDSQKPDNAYIYDDCIEQGRIAIGFGDANDFQDCDDRPAVVSKLESLGYEIAQNDFTPTAINIFKNQIRKDDFVVVSDGNLKFRAVGKVVGDYEFDPDYIYPHSRNVEWLRVFNESLPYGQLMRNRFSQMTLYRLHERSIKLDALKELLAPPQESSKETVVIIDEINRGNISKILGELITLLETDKRLGAVNELRARLPYSGEDFGIPSNLHVIGTMNTADRSLAHLDTALRRRFKFTEVMPDESLLGVISWNGKSVDLQQLLKVINYRIEALFDREHTIGHSYFMDSEGATVDAQNLPHTFQHKIIPLLTEYFFEDWSKVRAILGDDQVDDVNLQLITTQNLDDGILNMRAKKPKVFRLNTTALTNPDAYIKIYATSSNGSN